VSLVIRSWPLDVQRGRHGAAAVLDGLNLTRTSSRASSTTRHVRPLFAALSFRARVRECRQIADPPRLNAAGSGARNRVSDGFEVVERHREAFVDRRGTSTCDSSLRWGLIIYEFSFLKSPGDTKYDRPSPN